MVEDKRIVNVELSRREEEIVKGFEDSIVEREELRVEDPREGVYRDMVILKHGKYDLSGERSIPRPPWRIVFRDNLCPACNTYAELVGGTARKKMDRKDDAYVCSGCGFKISSELYDKGKERTDREISWVERDREFGKKIEKYEIDPRRLDELVDLGERRAAVRINRMYKTVEREEIKDEEQEE